VKKRIILATIGTAVLALGVVTASYAAKPSSHKKAAATFKVGLVTDIGGLNDRGFNHLAYVGLLRAEKKLHIKGRVLTSNSSADYIPNLSSLAKAGYNLVIGVGFLQEDAIQKMAAQFPNTKFAGVDMNATADFKNITKNFMGIIFQENQVGYMVGYLAGLEAKRLKKNTVSSVGGIPVPAVIRYIAGYQAGAKAAFPGVKTLNGYSQDFVAQPRCKEVALNQIQAGSVVVFQVAGGCGLGALDAAQEQHVWGIGVDADQGYLGTYVLTSALKRVDTAVYDAIHDAVNGKFKGGRDTVYGITEDGVGIGRFSPLAPKGIADKVAQVKADIVSGKIKNIPTIVK
jgi:basic membrane protein A